LEYSLRCTDTDHPDYLTLRKNYLLTCYEEKLNIVQILCGKQTTDATEMKDSNILQGFLEMADVEVISSTILGNEMIATRWNKRKLNHQTP
jgi:hypothetical protein